VQIEAAGSQRICTNLMGRRRKRLKGTVMAKTLHFDSDANMAFDATSRLPVPAANMSFAMELLTGPARLYRLAQAEWQHRRAMKELQDLDDRMLRDIGVNRSEIPGVARFGRGF
jgi:uncharacterized protein YjiS (DUF1127 family)